MSQENPFHSEFSYRPMLGGPSPEITRRDPSPVLEVDGAYYIYYSRSTHDPSGYFATLWWASSEDGRTWRERGEALDAGGEGEWDEHAVFTPTVMASQGRYYLFYTAVPEPFTNDDGGPKGTPTAIGVAVAGSPEGPWERFEGNPVLRPGGSGEFDSHRVDDSCMIVRQGRFWMYYKGREAGRTPGQTKMGLALADAPCGPYQKHPENPVLGSGHEVCVWPHGGGVAALVAPTGPEGRTVQWSPDGVHFSLKAHVDPPKAPGPYRPDQWRDVEHGEGITWGVCHLGAKAPLRPYLARFECDLRARMKPDDEQ